MNTLKIGLIAVIFSISLLHGEISINEQIKAMGEVPAQERAELMNVLKMRIASMNEGERIHSISALHTEMGGKTMTSGASPAVQRMQQMQSGQQGMNVQQIQSTQQSINVQQIQSRQQGTIIRRTIGDMPGTPFRRGY